MSIQTLPGCPSPHVSEKEDDVTIPQDNKKGRSTEDNEPPIKLSMVLMALMAITGWLMTWAWSSNTSDMKSIHGDLQKILEHQARDDEWKQGVGDHFDRVDKATDKMETYIESHRR